MMSKTTIPIIALAIIFITDTVNARENIFCQTRVHYGADEVKKFILNELVGGHKREDTIMFCHRAIEWRSHSRIYSLKTLIVYDAIAEDVETKLSVVVKSHRSTREAVDASLSALFTLLRMNDKISDACTVPNYPQGTVNPNGACPPGASVNTCTICDFQCAQQDKTLIGNPFLVCCGNTEFNGTVPSCQDNQHPVNKGTSMPPTRPVSGTSRDNQHPVHKRTSMPSIRPVSGTSEGVPEKLTSLSHLTTPSTLYSLSSSSLTSSAYSSATSKSATDIPTGRSGVNRLVYLSIPAGVVLLSLFTFWGIKIFPLSKTDNRIIESGIERSQEVYVIHPDNNGYYRYHYVKRATPTQKQLLLYENYDMGSVNKGTVFIINNHSISKDMRIKDGSDIDVTNIEHVFRDIGYESVVETGLTSDGIKSSIDRLKTRITRKHTSVVVVVMAHGNEHAILGVDEQAVPLDYIQDQFSTKNCPALEDKPKIFFYQCLKEKPKPRGATGMNSPQMKFGRADGKDGSASPDVTLGLSSPKSFLETDGFLIDNADSFIVQVIMKEYRSVRDGVNGSWFIQILCEELLAKAHKDNVDSIMTGVTRRVARIGNIQSPRIKKLGISKKIYFLPKYERERQMEDVDLPFTEGYFNANDETELLEL